MIERPVLDTIRALLKFKDHPTIAEIAKIAGLTIVKKPGMMRSAWFLKDAEGRILRSGVIGMGEIRTPGADQDTATTIECGSEIYAAIQAHTSREAQG